MSIWDQMRQGRKLSLICLNFHSLLHYFVVKFIKCTFRMLVTGMHIVCDINCISCHALLGWKYKEAHEESQVESLNIRFCVYKF